jgi:hypothetical protein
MSAKVRRVLTGTLLFVAMTVLFAAQSPGSPRDQNAAGESKPLDYEFFKARVEPIFLKKRPGHARCYACHGSGTGPQYLLPLPAGSDFWTEEQSRQIFQNVSSLVDTDDPMSSPFLIHPLSPLAGGDGHFAHSGGRQFESKDDPDWQIMLRWAKGEKASPAAR